MSVANLLLVAIGLFAFFKYVISPRIDEKAKLDERESSVVQYAKRNAVDFLSLFFLLTSISLLIALAVESYLTTDPGTSVSQVTATLEQINKIKEITSAIGTSWGFMATIILAIALAILSYNKGKSVAQSRIDDAKEKEFDRLIKELEEGDWPELEPNDEMKQIEEEITKAEAFIAELSAQDENNEHEEEIQDLIDFRQTLINTYQAMDISRRMDVKVEPEPEFKQEKGLFNKIKLLFISQGMVNTLKQGGSVTFILGILILFPSMLSAVGNSLNQEAQAKATAYSERLEDLKFEIAVEKSKSELKLAVNKLDTPAEETTKPTPTKQDKPALTEEDEAALDQIASAFEQNAFSVRAGGQLSRAAVQVSRRHSARQQILANVSHNNALLRVNNEGAFNEGIKQFVELDNLAKQNKGPVTPIGKQFRQELVDNIVTEKPSTWEQMKAATQNAKAAFQTPASPTQIKSMMVSNIVNNLIQAPDLNGISKAVQSGSATIASDTLADLYKAESNKFIKEVIETADLKQAVAAFKSSSRVQVPERFNASLEQKLSSIPTGEELISAFEKSPPSLTSIEQADMARSSQLVKNIAKVGGHGSNIPVDALASFADYFPGFQGEERTTSKAKANPKAVKASKIAYTRARDYLKLRGYSRIGGVLIGRMPENDKHLETERFQWQQDGEFISLYLKLNNREEVFLGKFHQEVVLSALGYAADGRVTTVTMVSSQPVFDLRILLHPALIDSIVGCYAIRLDQLADEQTSLIEEIQLSRAKANNAILNMELLYTYAWAIQLQTLIERNTFIRNEFAKDKQLSSYPLYAAQIIASYQGEAERIAKSKEFDLTFAKEKSAFFHKRLVKRIDKCTKSDGDLQSCLASGIPTMSDPFKNLWWLYRAPETTEWSGVREQAYKVDENLEFLTVNSGNSLWPLRYMVQRVFTSEPVFARDPEKFIDDQPYEFKQVNDLFTETLPVEFENNAEKAEVSSTMRSFVLLQRLFRLALSGYLGDEFPLQALVDMSSAIKVKPIRTLRWLPKPGVAERFFAREKVRDPDNLEKSEQKLQLINELRESLGIISDEVYLADKGAASCPAL